MNFVWSLIDSLSNKEPGEIVYILDDEGAIIAHPIRRFVYDQTDLSEFSFVQNLINGNEGTDTYLDPVSNETMICAYVPVEELHWGIVVAQPEAIAFAVSRDIINKLIFIMIGLTALASLLAVVITRNLVKPLNSLVAGVKSLYEGSLPGRISIPRTEELATLAIEFNRMTKNLENAQKKLKKAERVATMSKFASVVAHEIRNPFNSIVINMQVLRKGFENRESFSSLENFIEIIDAEIRRIDGLIKNYMSIAKPVEFKLVPHDINVLIDELIILQHEKAAKQSIRIESNYEMESTMVSVDVNQMKQAFLNIMLNAFEAMPGGGKLNISVNTDHDNSKYRDYIKISFSDSGVGIQPENISEVFDFFYTSKRSGTGLGLAVTQKIIQGHKGHIELESIINRGTKISIFLSQK
jgi:signal transduction histidine kinase